MPASAANGWLIRQIGCGPRPPPFRINQISHARSIVARSHLALNHNLSSPALVLRHQPVASSPRRHDGRKCAHVLGASHEAGLAGNCAFSCPLPASGQFAGEAHTDFRKIIAHSSKLCSNSCNKRRPTQKKKKNIIKKIILLKNPTR